MASEYYVCECCNKRQPSDYDSSLLKCKYCGGNIVPFNIFGNIDFGKHTAQKAPKKNEQDSIGITECDYNPDEVGLMPDDELKRAFDSHIKLSDDIANKNSFCETQCGNINFNKHTVQKAKKTNELDSSEITECYNNPDEVGSLPDDELKRIFDSINELSDDTINKVSLSGTLKPKKKQGRLIAVIFVVVIIIIAILCGSFLNNKSNNGSNDRNNNSSTEETNGYLYGDSDNGDDTQNTSPPTSDLLKLSIEPFLITNTSIEPYSKAENSISDAVFKYYSGTISQSPQEDQYSFTTSEEGIYRIELADMISDLKVSMFLYDSNGSRVDYNTGIGSGSGVTVSLNANSTYQLVIKSSSSVGSYTVFIGEQKSTVDLDGYTTIYDSIEFSGQQNNYSFTPPVSGVYRFYISQINSGIKISMYVYNDAGYRVDYITGIGQDSGVNVSLEAGKTYSLIIKQSSNVGSYTLAMGYQKPNTDITGFTKINDSMEFSGQQNNYSFTSSVSGVYRFYISQINSGIKVSMYVYDDAGYRVDYITGIGQDSGVNVSLEAGRTYSLIIKQSSSIGNYMLSIGYQKDTVDISKYDVVSDSIQFSGQENNYTYTPTSSGDYSFELSDILSGCKVSIYIYDSAGYRVDFYTGMSDDSSLKVNLDANMTYSVVIKQFSEYGDYTISILK